MSLPELKLSESEVASYINSRLVADYPQKVAMLQAIVNGDFEEAVNKSNPPSKKNLLMTLN
ncbi:MAG: hypothetical protein H6759_00335 [Candidatus Nomurabacteria bacterium]|nr:MAG: hypothetical protein H6759_00335 [Candidatus Nomurabacteria bacterium]